MKAMRIVVAVIAAMAVPLFAQSAYACEITRTPWGLRLINCKLSDFYKGRYEVAMDIYVSTPRLLLPNLHVTDIDTLVTGGNVDITFDVENSGGLNDALAFDVTVVGTVQNPLNAGLNVSTTPFPPVTVSALAIGASATRYAGTISLPNRNQDWDVCAIAIADPPATGGPAFGRVLESNESDNMLNACCRVFGPNPDVNGPPAC
jgi:hypothetical protein